LIKYGVTVEYTALEEAKAKSFTFFIAMTDMYSMLKAKEISVL